MTSFKIYNPLLGLNIPYCNSVLPTNPDNKNSLVENAPMDPKPLLVGPGLIGNPVGGQTGHNLYNPFSDYLGLAQMVERQHMADNFEKLVMETCIVPGEDIRNELNRLFVQDETSSNCSSGSKRERVNSWTSCSDSGHSSDSSSQSPVPNAVNNTLPEYKASMPTLNSQYVGHQVQSTKLHSNHYSQSVQQMSNNLSSKNSGSNGNMSPPVTNSNLLLKPAAANNGATVSQLQLNLPKPIAVSQSQHQHHVGHSLLSQPSSGSLVSSSSSASARLPPSVQLARKLTAKSMCVFCKNNGEMESVYSSHVLKNEEGAIVCPILRAYTCPICGVSGDNAHTIKYCPQGNNESTIKALKQTRNSTARRSNTSTVSGSLTSAGTPASLLRGSVASCVTTSSSLNGLPIGPGASHAHSISSHLQQQNQANAGHFSGTSSPFGHQAASVVTGANSQQVAAAAALLNAAHLYSTSSKKF